MRAPLLFFALAACGGGSHATVDGPSADAKIDARVFLDAPPNVPDMITISGIVTGDNATSSMPLTGAMVSIYKQSDEGTALGTATSGADGSYSIMISTGGLVVDAFVKATFSGYTNDYVYPVKPYQADTTTNVDMVSTTNFGALTFIVGQTAGNGLVVVEVVDSTGADVQGATVNSDPASGLYRYDSGGEPFGKVSTDTDGVGFCINVPPSTPVTVGAAKAGDSFKSHTLVAHPDAFTNTIVTE